LYWKFGTILLASVHVVEGRCSVQPAGQKKKTVA
jgi:hypothetical protein